MTVKQRPDDTILTAYVDGELDAPGVAEVERAMAADPAIEQHVRTLLDSTATLRSAFNAPIHEVVPARLLAPINAPRNSTRRGGFQRSMAIAASIAVAMVAGIALYAGAGFELPYRIVATPHNNWLTSVANYHTTYVRTAARGERHLVDIGGEDFSYLETWFGKRLTRNVHLPRMEHVGYRIQGGRVMFVESQPAAQFFYKAAGSDDVVSITIAQTQRKDTGWTVTKRNGVNVIYWRKSGYAYVFAGIVDRQTLHSVVASLPNDIEKI